MKSQKILDKLNITIHQACENVYDGWDVLLEHADRAGDIKNEIRSLTPDLFEHIYKCIIYKETIKYKDTRHHWAAEIAANLTKYCRKRVKNSKNILSTKTIVNTMIGKIMDVGEMQDIIYKCEQQYGLPLDLNGNIKEVNYEQVYNKIVLTLPPLIDYTKQVIKPDVDKILKIIEKDI